MSDTTPKNEKPTVDWKISLAISVVIMLAAGSLAGLTFFTEPQAKKGGATKKTAMLVDAVEVERGDFRPRIVAQGTVEPARDIVLRPEVGGRITSLSPAFTPGNHIEEGERLLRIEPADFRYELAQRRSDLRQAESDLAVEEGRHDSAKSEYAEISDNLSPEKEARVLRKPQLEAAKEQVEAARAAVEQAKLNLRRTTVEAPFDAHILRRDVNVGSQVSPSEDLGRLVGMEAYWVAVELPLSKLRWVTFADEEDAGSRVRVRNRQAWPEESFRAGHLFKKVGALDGDTRMARALASIPDPLALDTEVPDKPALTIGEFVEVSIQGETLEDVVRISRDYMRENDTVWVMEENKLQVREAEVITRDADYAYVSDGLDGGEKVVTTHLSTVVEGAPLRLSTEEEASSE